MQEFEITTDSGLTLTLEASGTPTEEDVMAFLRDRQKQAVLNVAKGPGFTDTRTKRGRRIKENPKKYYSEHIPAALNIPPEKFNYSKSLPIGLRSKLDFLQDSSSRAAILRQEYGDDNVTQLNVGGNPAILFRDSDSGEWAMADSLEFEFADLTSDIAGDIIPVTAGVAAGLGTLIATSPTAVGTAGTVPALATATAAAATEATVGTAQDIVARKLFGLEAEAGQLAKQRAKEMVVNFAIDYGTMKTGRAIKAFVGPRGTDLATEELLKTAEVLNRQMPTVAMQGQKGIERLQGVASKFPDSTPARFLQDARDATGQRFANEFGAVELTPEATESLLQRGLQSMTTQAKEDISKIKSSLDELATTRKKADSLTEQKLAREANKKAQTVYNAELQRRAKNVTTKGDISPEKTGLSLQSRITDNYIQTEAKSKNAFNNAYFKLQNVKTTSNKLSDVFGKTKKQAILDNEDEVIQVLAPGGRTASGRAVSSLDEIADESISFQQLNELIQLLEEKTKRGAATPGFNAGEYRKLTNELRKQRTALLNQADPDARKAYNQANKFFREKVLPFRESDIFASIRPEIGQNYSKAIDQAVLGKPHVTPKLNLGGTEVLQKALANPKSAKDFLRAANDSLEAKKLLRNAWLTSKGLTGGQPIPKRALKFSPKDLDIARVLWPSAGEAGFNRKVQTLKSLERFADQRDDFIDGVTAETFDRLMNEGFSDAQKQVQKIAQKEVSQKKALDEMQGTVLVKLMGQGKVPLPNNAVTIESFGESILKTQNPADLKAFIGRVQDESPELLDAVQMSMYQALTRKAGRGTDLAQVGNLGFSLWNPKSMSKLLRDHENQLREVLGKKSYQSLVDMNNGLTRLSVQRGAKPEGRIGAAGAGGGISLFFSNLSGAVKDRFAKHTIAAQIKSPFPFKKIVSQEQYNRFMNSVMTGTFIGTSGIQALMEDADADPEFRKKMTELYADILSQ
jgi:hypothetical protein